MSETSLIQNPKRFNSFRLIARIFAGFFIIQFLVFLIPVVLNHSHQLVSGKASGNLVIYGCGFGIYFIGLLIGFKWEGLGGLFCLSCLMIFLCYSIVFMNLGEGIWLLTFSIIFSMVPCIFYLLSWNFRRKAERGLKD
jgi:hypothetical protein